MLHRSIFAFLLVWAAAVTIMAAAVLLPATNSHNCTRSLQGEPIPGSFYAGDTLLLTNWVFYADNGITLQSLDGLALIFVVGEPGGDATTVTGRVDDAEAGLASALVTIPTNTFDPQFIQVSIVDTNAEQSFTYPLYELKVRPRLGR